MKKIIQTMLITSFTLLAQSAMAQPDPVKLMSHDLKLQQCSVNLKATKVVKGNIQGIGDVTVVAMPAEGCGGSNEGNTMVQAFYGNHRTEMFGVETADKVTIENNQILVSSVAFGENDPACCPSLHKTYKFIVKNNKLIEMK